MLAPLHSPFSAPLPSSSFSWHGEIFRCNGEQCKPAPQLIASMSLQLVIPGWVALQQSPLALRQLNRSCQNTRLVGTEEHRAALPREAIQNSKTVKDVPIQTVKDVPVLDTLFAWMGGDWRGVILALG
jgi:hypothetical protein